MNKTDRIRATVRRLQDDADRMSPPLEDGTRTNRLIHSGIETFYERPPFMYMGLRPTRQCSATRCTGRIQHLGRRRSGGRPGLVEGFVGAAGRAIDTGRARPPATDSHVLHEPVPYRLDDAGRIAADGPAARAIGLQLLEAMRPRVLISDGNSEGDRWTSPWAYARRSAPDEQVVTRGPVPPNYS